MALLKGTKQIELSISDDGCGFEPGAVNAGAGHFGLTIMRERAKLVGARFRVHSQRGRGTKAVFTLPIPMSQ